MAHPENRGAEPGAKVQLVLRAALVAAGLLLAHPVVAAELLGIVTEVHDGDSLTLVSGQATHRIRLNDIDAPELRQESGKDSRLSLVEICGAKQATADVKGKDRYGRILAVISCAGVNANAEQVRLGWAWVYVRYAPKDSPLYGFQQEARRSKRGLWADAEALPPWEWRRL
jgi:endonuclease YncB( thermonuclease family)